MVDKIKSQPEKKRQIQSVKKTREGINWRKASWFTNTELGMINIFDLIQASNINLASNCTTVKNELVIEDEETSENAALTKSHDANRSRPRIDEDEFDDYYKKATKKGQQYDIDDPSDESALDQNDFNDTQKNEVKTTNKNEEKAKEIVDNFSLQLVTLAELNNESLTWSEKVKRFFKNTPMFANYHNTNGVEEWCLRILGGVNFVVLGIPELIVKGTAALFNILDVYIKSKMDKATGWSYVGFCFLRLFTLPLKLFVSTPLFFIGNLLENCKGIFDGIANILVSVVSNNKLERFKAGMKCFGRNLLQLIPTALVVAALVVSCIYAPPVAHFVSSVGNAFIGAFVNGASAIAGSIMASVVTGLSMIGQGLNHLFNKFCVNPIAESCNKKFDSMFKTNKKSPILKVVSSGAKQDKAPASPLERSFSSDQLERSFSSDNVISERFAANRDPKTGRKISKSRSNSELREEPTDPSQSDSDSDSNVLISSQSFLNRLRNNDARNKKDNSKEPSMIPSRSQSPTAK